MRSQTRPPAMPVSERRRLKPGKWDATGTCETAGGTMHCLGIGQNADEAMFYNETARNHAVRCVNIMPELLGVAKQVLASLEKGIPVESDPYLQEYLRRLIAKVEVEANPEQQQLRRP